MSKRAAATRGRPPVAKKIKVESPQKELNLLKPSLVRNNEVQEKVKLLVRCFDDEEQMALIPLSNEARDLLQATVPTVLGEGSASDERHAYQTRMANAIGQTFAEFVKGGDDKVLQAKNALKTAEEGHTQAVAAVATAKSNLEERAQDVKNKKEQFDKSLPAVSEEEQKVAAGEKEVDKFKGQLQKRREDRDKFHTAIQDTYEVLKAGEWESPAAQKKGEKKLLTSLESTLKKLKADSSMFVAIRNALTKPPADRSSFDNMAMQQVEAKLNGHLQTLEEQLASAEKINAEKVGVCAEAAAALEAAQKTRSDLKQEHDAAKAAKSEGDANLKNARQTLEATEVALAEARSALEAGEHLAAKTKETMDAFTFLYERRINPDSPPCPSPCRVSIQKVEEPVANHEAVEPSGRESPGKVPTVAQAFQGSPQSAKGSPRSAKGSPAKVSAAKVNTTPASVAQSPVTKAMSPQVSETACSSPPNMAETAPCSEETAVTAPEEAETQADNGEYDGAAAGDVAMEETAVTVKETETQDAAHEDQMTDAIPTEEEEEM